MLLLLLLLLPPRLLLSATDCDREAADISLALVTVVASAPAPAPVQVLRRRHLPSRRVTATVRIGDKPDNCCESPPGNPGMAATLSSAPNWFTSASCRCIIHASPAPCSASVRGVGVTPSLPSLLHPGSSWHTLCGACRTTKAGEIILLVQSTLLARPQVAVIGVPSSFEGIGSRVGVNRL